MHSPLTSRSAGRCTVPTKAKLKDIALITVLEWNKRIKRKKKKLLTEILLIHLPSLQKQLSNFYHRMIAIKLIYQIRLDPQNNL